MEVVEGVLGRQVGVADGGWGPLDPGPAYVLPLLPGVTLNALDYQGRSQGPLWGGSRPPTLEVGRLRHHVRSHGL